MSPQPSDKKLRLPVISPALLLVVAAPMAATIAYPHIHVLGSPTGWAASLRGAIRNRAILELAEDFAPDLRRWASSDGSPRNWVSDPSGFVRPAQLALY